MLAFADIATADVVKIDAPPRSAGVHDIEARLDNGEPARFTLSLPLLHDGECAPLVLVLHYAGQPTRFYGRPLLEQLIEPALRPLRAVYVAPEALDGPWHTAKNEAWVMQLLDLVSAVYATDPLRVVVSGYSMGAMGTWHLISHYPARFSAAIPISGFPGADLACTIPVYTLHAPADELFPYDRLADRVAELAAQNYPIHMEKVEAQGHFDLQGFSTALGAVPAWLETVWTTRSDPGRRD